MASAFVACCALGLGVAYSGRWFLFESETTQKAAVTLITGSVDYTEPGANAQILGLQPVSIVEATEINSGAGSQAAVSFYTPDSQTTLGSMQVYSRSSVQLSRFRTPRFEWSSRPHTMEVNMLRGRARVSLAVNVARQIVIVMKTPHGEVQLNRPGSYSVEVTDQATEVVVRNGAAIALGEGKSVILVDGERTLIPEGKGPVGVLTGERNLVINGDFVAPLSPADWNIESQRAVPEDVVGVIERMVDAGQNVIHFNRPGRNSGRVGITQSINRDVRDYRSLSLHLALKIVRQDILVCGTYGSECPVMVKIEYTNLAGNRNEWVQGFYSLHDPGNSVPRQCYTCPAPKADHLLVQREIWYSYDSPDLLALLNKPTIINTLAVYAEGHTFESFVAEVELQARD